MTDLVKKELEIIDIKYNRYRFFRHDRKTGVLLDYLLFFFEKEIIATTFID